MPADRYPRSVAVLAIAALAALSLAAPVLAKESDAGARLDAPLAGDTPGGTTLTIGYTAWVGDGAARSPLFGSPVFVRLISPTGEAVTEFGTEGRDTPGHYVARLVSPARGIARVEVGMRGTRCTDGGDCRTVDEAFTDPVENALVNPAVAALAATAPAPAVLDPAWTIGAAVAGGVLLLTVATFALRQRRPAVRGRSATDAAGG